MKTVNGILNLIQEYAADYHDSYYSKSTAERLRALRTAIEELAADAARYRWMRATTNYVTSKGKRIDVRNNPEAWDEAIDAAMKEST